MPLHFPPSLQLEAQGASGQNLSVLCSTVVNACCVPLQAQLGLLTLAPKNDAALSHLKRLSKEASGETHASVRMSMLRE